MKGNWRKLTRAEKLARVFLKTLRLALSAAIVAAIGSIIVGVFFGVLVAVGVSNAFVGGFRNAGRANTYKMYGHYNKW